ncbi:uncharacterized protein LAJ45_03047 [Morchella importuna]|uniref:uncharacterized protein n=1 Tax=Morchella importuna TaxID=1174673 RepID=UPI001E8EE69A|nr:uncharacterized protein LAJ45_03047 [Morchella importuna]KAH8152821.1 hypothetical protein LAJ45_03047 [Morchella importuna]
MAEAIGLAASIIGVVKITGSLVSLGYNYLGGVRDVSNELRKLVDELHSLAQVLLVLRDHARDDILLQPTALQRLNDQNGPLPRCALELKTLQGKLEPKLGLRGMVKYLLWPLKEKETLQYIDSIERYKSLFNLALTTDHFALSRTIDGCVRDTNQIMHELRNESSVLTSHVDRMLTAEKRNKILNWLYPGNFDQKHVEINQPDYLMLWGYGIPGAGKTFISSSIIDYLKTQKSGGNYGIAPRGCFSLYASISSTYASRQP